MHQVAHMYMCVVALAYMWTCMWTYMCCCQCVRVCVSVRMRVLMRVLKAQARQRPAKGGRCAMLPHLVSSPWTVDSGPLSTLSHRAMDLTTSVQESGEKMQANARLYLADARNIGWKCV